MASSATKVALGVPRMWHVIDAKNQIVGRLAPQVSRLLMGKHKPTYMASADAGDWVVVLNAKGGVLTGDKMRDKLYRWHTGWMGGLKSLTARQVHERAPERILEHAVKGMLPQNRLRSIRMRRLRIFEGDEHPYGAQVAACARYAPTHAAAFAARSFEPKPVAASGTLVKNRFPDALGAAELAEAAKGLAVESKADALAALEAEFAKRRRRGLGGATGEPAEATKLA